MMKNKKGQLLAGLSAGVIAIIVTGIILIVAGILIFTSVNKFAIIGGGVIALTLIFGFKGEFNKSKGIFMLVLVGVGLIFIFASSTLQDITTGNYIQAPTFYYYECNAASQPVESTHVNLAGGTTNGWIKCPTNTDTCDLWIAQKETPKWFATDRRIAYTICHNNMGNCDPEITTPANSFLSKNGVPTQHIPNLLTTDSVWINYQYQTLLGVWKTNTDPNVAEWYQTYKPFILWKVDMFGGGKTEYTTISQGCNFPSASVGNLLNSITNSIKQINTQTSTSNTNVPFYKTRNFIGTYVPISTANVNFVTYNGQSGYCLNRQVFAITTAVTNGATYKIIDSNFNTRLANSVTCCPGETEPTRKCNSNFQWENIAVAQCSAFNPCAGADWMPSSAKTLIRYNCINSKCVAETKAVQCISNLDCGNNQVCDTLTYICENVGAGDIIGNESMTNVDCITKAESNPLLGYEWVETSTSSCGWNPLCLVGITQPKVTTTGTCKPSFLVYWLISGVVLVLGVVGIVALKMNKKGRKKRR